MKVLSVICARADSKGLKNKCMVQIGSKMVVEYTIEYSLSLGESVKTVVSTDIEEIIDYCRKNNVAFIRREATLCTDESKIDDALADAIEKEGRGYQYCSLAYGNVPIRYPGIFHKALRFLENNRNYDAVISMQNVEKFHPEWIFDYSEDIVPKVRVLSYRRQRLPQKMIHDGHTLIFRIEGFLERYKRSDNRGSKYIYSIFGKKIKPLINSEIIIDIDTEKDLKLAKAFLLGCPGLIER